MIENRAVVIHGAHDIRVESRPEPLPGEGSVQVEVELGGICGSDLSYYRHGAVGDFRVQRPMILGHEVVGVVSKVGAGVSGAYEGMRVAVDPSTPCGRCDRCREGRTNVCLHPVFLGSASTDPHVDGGFSSLMTTKVQNLVEIAPGLSSRDIVFAEPLAVTLHAIDRCGGVAGRRVLIIGAGPIGSMAAAAALRLGAGQVVVSDLDPTRLEIVGQLGELVTTLATEAEFDAEFDVVIEASGSGAGIATAFQAVRKAGQVVLVGLPHGGPVALPIGLAVSREVDVVGSFRFCHGEFDAAVQLLADGLDLAPLLTDSFHAEHALDAFELAGGSSSMKVQLEFGSSQ